MAKFHAKRHFRLRPFLYGGVLALSVACSPITQNHGYFPPEDLLAQLVNIKLGLLKGLPPVFGDLNNLPVKHLLCGLLFIFVFIFIL